MKIKINLLKCVRCNHTWAPRKVEVRLCPKCKTAYFDKPKENIDKTNKKCL